MACRARPGWVCALLLLSCSAESAAAESSCAAGGSQRASVQAGSSGNRLRIVVVNGDRATARKLRVTADSRPDFVRSVDIVPGEVEELSPGAEQVFEIRFDVAGTAGSGSLVFHATSDGGAIERGCHEIWLDSRAPPTAAHDPENPPGGATPSPSAGRDPIPPQGAGTTPAADCASTDAALSAARTTIDATRSAIAALDQELRAAAGELVPRKVLSELQTAADDAEFERRRAVSRARDAESAAVEACRAADAMVLAAASEVGRFQGESQAAERRARAAYHGCEASEAEAFRAVRDAEARGANLAAEPEALRGARSGIATQRAALGSVLGTLDTEGCPELRAHLAAERDRARSLRSELDRLETRIGAAERLRAEMLATADGVLAASRSAAGEASAATNAASASADRARACASRVPPAPTLRVSETVTGEWGEEQSVVEPGNMQPAGGEPGSAWDEAAAGGRRTTSGAGNEPAPAGGDAGPLLAAAADSYGACDFAGAQALLAQAMAIAPLDPRAGRLGGLIAAQLQAASLYNAAVGAASAEQALALLAEAEAATGSAATAPPCLRGRIVDARSRISATQVRDRAAADEQRARAAWSQAASALIGTLIPLYNAGVAAQGGSTPTVPGGGRSTAPGAGASAGGAGGSGSYCHIQWMPRGLAEAAKVALLFVRQPTANLVQYVVHEVPAEDENLAVANWRSAGFTLKNRYGSYDAAAGEARRHCPNPVTPPS